MGNNFRESIKVNSKPLDIMQFNQKKQQKPLEVMKFKTNFPREEKSPTKEVHKIPKKKLKRRINVKGIAQLGLGTLLASGIAYGGISHWQNSQSVTLEEAKEIGKTVEQLKITPEQEQQYEEIKQMLDNDSASDYELLRNLNNLAELNMDIQKTKIANSMNTQKENIKLYSGISRSEKGQTEEMIIVDEKIYENYYMSSDMSNSIKDLVNIMQDIEGMRDRDINKENIINKTKKHLDTTSKMAASEVEYENGKIEMKRTTRGEVNKIKEEQQKQQEDFER